MKIYFWFCLVVLCSINTKFIQSQNIQGVVIAGFNLSQVDGDEVFGFYKPGANTGLAAIVPLGNSFNFTIETLFNQKGAYQGDQYLDTIAGNVFTGEYNLRLNYVEVPLLFFYNDKDVIMAGAGFSFGRLVGVKEYEHGQLMTGTTLNSGVYDRNDFNVIADLRFRVHKKFYGNIRYAYSLASIRTREFENFLGNTWIREQYNNLLSFRLIYIFNDQPPIKDSRK